MSPGDNSPLRSDLADLLVMPAQAGPSEGHATQAIAFFDLVGSTARKLNHGHIEGVRAAMAHNGTCRAVAAKFNGTVVKELGDGVLATFDDPLDAVLAAVNVRAALALTENLETRVGLTLGRVQHVVIDDSPDILGSAVDRCARVQAAAGPGQIVVDSGIAEAVQSYLADYNALSLAGPERLELAGLGQVELFAIVEPGVPARSAFKQSFRWFESGRLLVTAKAHFLASASREVIEIGTGLTAFAGYFDQHNPELFKLPVFSAIDRGVSVRCYALDPDSETAATYLADRGEPDYAARTADALRRLKAIEQEVADAGMAGTFEVFTYDHYPTFYALGVDLGELASNPEGEMMASPYLLGVPRAESPVMQFSAATNPVLFERFRASIKKLIAEAQRV